MNQFTIPALIGSAFVFIVIFLILDLIIKLFVKDKKRPSEIIVISIILVIGAISQLMSIVNGTASNIIPIITSILSMFWLYGIWNMKKWGVIGYTITIFIVQVILLLQNKFTIFSILLLLPLVILYYYYPKMKQ